jgi:hypothetical protein
MAIARATIELRNPTRTDLVVHPATRSVMVNPASPNLPSSLA